MDEKEMEDNVKGAYVVEGICDEWTPLPGGGCNCVAMAEWETDDETIRVTTIVYRFPKKEREKAESTQA